jgi:ParB family chromosome partitioning protein
MKLDLSGLDQFKASALLDPVSSPGAPAEMALDRIDFDPAQPRRALDEAALNELAESIRAHGVLEPVSLRSSAMEGRYIVNRGERRVRASRLAGRSTVPWFLDERVDPFIQAIENLQREDLSPFDLATFIAEREAEGHSRAEIARRLHKPKSFITEAAGLVDAPAPVRALYDKGRARDTRVLYRVAKGLAERPKQAQALLDGEGPVTRAMVDRALPVGGVEVEEGAGRRIETSKPLRSLLVEHSGRKGRLRLKGQPGRRTGVVNFEDGTQGLVELSELRLVAWTAK